MPITVIRWILVPFAAWLAWGVAVFAGFELEALVTYLCPENKMVSGMCTTEWYGVALDSIFAFGAAMAAALIVLLCTLVAPASREQVSRATYLVGAVAAVVMGISAHAILPLVCALIAGALVWRWFDRRALWPLRL
jgi:hypothetical protein